MLPKELVFGNVRVQLLGSEERFEGLGSISINNTPVRGNALPLRPFAETLLGLRFDDMQFLGVEQRDGGVDIRARWIARDNDWEIRLDHSLDRIINVNAWDRAPRAAAEVRFILRPSKQIIDGVTFEGFSYAFAVKSEQPIHLLVDRSTWEIGGKITGNNFYGQINFGSPSVTYTLDTDDSDEGIIDFPLNPQMTQALPRWAGGPTVDYLLKGSDALVLFYERVALIRSVMKKTRGEDTLKFFEQHYFDSNTEQATSPRHVLLSSSAKMEVDHQNLWTRWQDYTGQRALDEFGMTEQPFSIVLSENYWDNFTFESYQKDLIPAGKALNYGALFIDPIWENDMTKRRSGDHSSTGKRYGNMCCPWEYDIAKVLGGEEKLRATVDIAHEAGCKVVSWLGTHVSSLYLDPHTKDEQRKTWKYVTLADGRHKYGSGYDEIHGMDLNTPYAQYVSDRVAYAHQATGIDGFLYDSFYNFGFMPVTYNVDGKLTARTQFRGCVEMVKRFRDSGCHILIESLGPWAQVQHGCSSQYNDDRNEFIRYKGTFSPGYSTIPVGQEKMRISSDAQKHFRLVSGKSQLNIPLFINKQRLDEIADPLLGQVNGAYRKVAKDMAVRTLLPDGQGALWRDAAGGKATLFAFKNAAMKVPHGAKVRQIFDGAEAAVSGDSLAAREYQVYQW